MNVAVNIRILADGRPDLCKRTKVLWGRIESDLLVKLWTEELSCSAIAAEINRQTGSRFSRNAVIGKVHRLDLPMRGSSFQYRNLTDEQKKERKRKREATFRERRRQANTYTRHRNAPRLFIVETPPVNDLEIPVEQRKTFTQLDNCHCRWPVGEPGTPEFFFCGSAEADLFNGRPYCRSHQFRATRRAA